MYAVVITDEGGVRKRLDFSKPEVTVGRVQGNDIVLPKRNVSKQHARLTLKDDQPLVVDLNSTNGTWVNGRKITSPHPLKQGDKIYIADFILTLEPANDRVQQSVGPRVSEPPPLPPKKAALAESSVPARRPPVSPRPAASNSRAPAASDLGGTSLPPSAEERATDAPPTPAPEPAPAPKKTRAPGPTSNPLDVLLTRLAERIDIDDVDPAAIKNQERWSATRAAIAETFLAMQADGSVQADVDMRHIAHVALHEAVGLGALDDLLSDESVRAIFIEGHDRILVDKGEGLARLQSGFSSPRALERIARRLAAQAGRELGASQALHGRLSFGPRLTILQAPLVARGPVIELRVGVARSLNDLAEAGWMSADAATHLAKAVAECRNIVVAGPRGSGVTEILSALANELSKDERIVAVEAVPDLEIDRTRLVSLASSDAGMSLSEAIEQGARLRADRLVINDLSGAHTMVALSTLLGREPGHLLGVSCWSHKGPIEGLTLAAGCGGAERACVAQLVGSTVDLVVATERGASGPSVSGILEIQGHEGGDISFQSVAL